MDSPFERNPGIPSGTPLEGEGGPQHLHTQNFKVVANNHELLRVFHRLS